MSDRRDEPAERSAIEGQLLATERAHRLGAPTRRGFLRIGGLGLAGSAVLAACGSDDGGGEAVRRTTSTTAAPGTTPSEETNLVLLNTAISLELVALDTYRAGFEAGIISSAPIADAARMFQAHHVEHRDALAAVVERAGLEPYATPNAVVKAAFVDPALRSMASEADFVRLAYDLERAAAQTYCHAATLLTTGELRQSAVSAGSIELRHATVLELLGGLVNEAPSALPSTNPLPSDALIPMSDPGPAEDGGAGG